MSKNNSDGFLAHFAAKWPEDVAQRGFVPVPKCLITCMGELGLKPQEAVVLFNIIERCWFVGEKSWQKVDTIAYNIGRKNSATREITKSLAKKGFITKEQRYNTSNLYGLEPTAAKLAEHMKHCKHLARKSEEHSQKSDGLDSQDTSDYLEPSLHRTTTYNINSPDSLFGSHDQTPNNSSDFSVTGEEGSFNQHLGMNHKHEWEEFTKERVLANGEEVTYYYRHCLGCDSTYHKKGDWPWVGDY